jgi:hypothetical protein
MRSQARRQCQRPVDAAQREIAFSTSLGAPAMPIGIDAASTASKGPKRGGRVA